MNRRTFLKVGSVVVAALGGIGIGQARGDAPAVRGWKPETERYFLLRSDTLTHCIYCGADTHGWMTTNCRLKDYDQADQHLPMVFSLDDPWCPDGWRQVVFRPGLFPTGTRLWRMDDLSNVHGEVLA